ncbi:hypothetical protein KOR34_26070 [Posidoniimonas corsicana]|uniref:Uncharacterized protein n=1 Tax=Posidoniimonas corsicana TaxID=1938618 RepID=A0A5C5VIE9_9BACT|nr:hypothetical protein [Posidoniimonas corsicana]TWT37649.1 hypothetical protein KOR34_26070 [Posidoniimonas corsicana]
MSENAREPSSIRMVTRTAQQFSSVASGPAWQQRVTPSGSGCGGLLTTGVEWSGVSMAGGIVAAQAGLHESGGYVVALRARTA